MTTRRTKRDDTAPRLDTARLADRADPDDLLEHWLPRYVPGRPFDDNAFSLARPLWGKTRAEWTLCLAWEVAERFPETAESDQGAGWVAGVLWAAAVDEEMQQSDELWEHTLDDITKMTGVSRQSAEQRWELLKGARLDRPVHPSTYWI